MRDWGQELLRGTTGRLVRITRAFDREDSADGERGPLELTFEGGRVLHLAAAPHDDFISVREGPWHGDAGDADRVLVDVSDRPGYAEAVGEWCHVGSGWLVNPDGCVAGVELHFGVATITFAIRGGGEYVAFGRASALPREWGLQRWPDMTMEA